jgi:tetratricopeptide (TPR) repeat protein
MLPMITKYAIRTWRLSFVGAILLLLGMTYCLSSFGQSQPPPQQPGQQPAPAGSSPAPDPSQESSSKKEPLPDSPSESSSKKDPIPDSAADQPKSKGTKPGVLPPETDPAWDPFHAQQDIEVGEFYLHKGDLDAAITRFEDAVRLRANFAKPRLLLAETYEKKGDKSEALRYYKEYLQVLPGAPDAKKIQQKIDKLSKNAK